MKTRILNLALLLAFVVSLGVAQPVTAQPAAADPQTWYVSSTMGNDANACNAVETPCLTINAAIGQSTDGDTVKVAIGTYTSSGHEVVLINKGITLSGGWDEAYTTQDGMSTIDALYDGVTARRGINITTITPVIVEYLIVQNAGGQSIGGGVYSNVSSNLTLTHSIIKNNRSNWMGAGVNANGDVTINDTWITGNVAGQTGHSGGGGGAGISSGGTLTLNNVTVSNNHFNGTYEGSGIYVYSVLVLNNSTVSGNSGGHGAITTFGGTIFVNNSTVFGNHSSVGIKYFFGKLTMQNSIIANNGLNGDCTDDGYNGTVTSEGYNLIGNNSICQVTSSTGDIIGTSANPVDPRLLPLSGEGVPTHALLSNSPAVEAGSPTSCLPTDQRGVARPVGNACDIGAYEGSLPGVASFARMNPNPSSLPLVDFQITFTDPVTGVDEADFSVDSTGVDGAMITSINGSEAIYTITVDTGTWASNATLGLNLVDDDSIKSDSAIPIGGIGAENGNYSSDKYTLIGPAVSTITLYYSSPTGQSNVDFFVIFSENVTGVDVTDFTLTTYGTSGSSVTSVNGSGAIYIVTTNAGTWAENATLRLDVVDDDSIKTDSDVPLGGNGAGNGNYSAGPAYRFNTNSSDTIITAATTPTLKWSDIDKASQYQYQMYKGTKLIYSKTVAASSCGSMCTNTPNIVLTYGTYKWQVRAMVNGQWTSYGSYRKIIISPAKPGYWQSAGISLYTLSSTPKVSNFTVSIYVNGCGGYLVTRTVPSNINFTGKSFSFNGPFYAKGTFTSPTRVSGFLGFSHYHLVGCGYISGGPFGWSSRLHSKRQPSLLNELEKQLFSDILITPDMEQLESPIILDVEK